MEWILFIKPDYLALTSDLSRPFGRPVYPFGHPNSGAQKTLQVFFFQFDFNKNTLNSNQHFTMRLIISKFLRKQKCRQKRKTARQKDIKVKQKISMKMLSFIQIRIRSHRCSHFFLDFFTKLLPFIKWHEYFTLLHVLFSVFLHLLSSENSVSHKFTAIQSFYLNIWIPKKKYEEECFVM